MRRILTSLLGLFIVAGFAFPVALAAAEQRPNLVVVFIDDMGWGDLSCFGNPRVKTKNLDRLAAEGLRFHQFYVNAPICSPSRAALTTGQYPQRWRITSFLNNRASNEERGMAQWLDVRAPSVARMLKSHGYATGHFGKWHLGGQRDVGEAPLISEYGFDETLTNFEGLGPRLLGLCYDADGKLVRRQGLGSENLGRGPIISIDRSQLTAAYISAAVEFIRKAAATGQPFYVNVWPDDVHSPFFPPPARQSAGGKRARYEAVLETMDEQLAPLFDLLRSNPKLRDNTILLFCSDNGPEPGAGSAGPFRGSKGMLYEGGVRSPLIVWAPGFMPPEVQGSINTNSFFSAMDLVPSMLGLARVAVPAGVRLDGEDVGAVLLGKSAAGRAAPLFFRRPPDRKNMGGGRDLPDLAVRAGNLKLLCDYDGARPELYDLVTDPGEKNNLAAAQPEAVKRLVAEVAAWHQSLPPDQTPREPLRQ
jgi:arylsulfatase A-like enzyme